MKSINEIRKELLKACRENGGTITDVEIILILPKDKDVINEDEFIKRFNDIKTGRGRKSLIRGLSTQAKNNLKKLIKRGYTWKELEFAINGMYLSGWAEANDNDTPMHLLREDNFDRYLTLYLNNESNEETQKETESKAKEKQKQIEQQEADRKAREEEQAKKELEALKKECLRHFQNLVGWGSESWNRSKYDAKLISSEVSKGVVSLEEKKQIFADVINAEELKDVTVPKLNAHQKRDIEERYKKMRENWENASFEVSAICAEKVVNLSLKRLKK